MAEDDNDKPRPKPSHTLGQPLEAVSIEEIDERIALLREEILRLEAVRAQKQAAQAAADAFFRK
jgi:uncharacterized small protein (DUF1192 family)